jgi:DNA-binding CsgD family transcriptional regulator
VSQWQWAQRDAAALIGRDLELETLQAAVAEARTGHGRIALITGEPGIGKTALLACILDHAAGHGVRIAAGAAEELELRVPFAAITDCLRRAGAASGQPDAEITALVQGAHRPSAALSEADADFVVAEAIIGLVEDWCAAGPVAIALDDLQWADEASIVVLHRLGRVAGQLPLLLAATCRSGAGGANAELLTKSWEARGATRLQLLGLDEASVASLAGRVAGDEPAPNLLARVKAASGNPLYVIEMVRALVSDGQDSLLAQAGSSPDAALIPESLVAVVTRRLSSVSAHTRRVLPIAAVLGPSFTVAELSAVLAASALDLLPVVQEAATAGILVAESDRLAFRHELIRQALYSEVPASARNALHLQAGQALAAAGAPPERAAQHLLAGMTVDSRTLQWLASSADRLSARAPELASDLIQRVLDHATPAAGQAMQLRSALAGGLFRAGKFDQAEAAATEALAHGNADHRGRLQWIQAQSRLNRGRVAAALTGIRQALDGSGLSRAELARFHGLAAQCLHVLSRTGPDAAMREAEGARLEGEASGDAHALAYGLQAVAGASRWQGRFAQAAELAAQAAAALEAGGPIIDSQLDPNLIRANCLFDLDRDAEAQRAYAADLRLAERGQGTFFLCLHHLSVARFWFLTGRWSDALSEIGAAREVPDHLGCKVHLDGLAALIAVHREDRAELARLRPALDQPLPTGTIRHTIDDRSWGRAMAALADGQRKIAFTTLCDAWQDCVTGQREYCGHYLLPELAVLAIQLGEQQTALRAVDALKRYLADRDAPGLQRSARFAAAILDGDQRSLVAVAEEYATAGRPMLEAQAREHAAEALAVAGRDQESRRQLDAAQSLYTALDARWDAARADARLRAHGIRRGVHGPRRRPKAGWAALTDTERRVASLLAEGLSNPEIASRMFTSRRTIQFHVSNILAKLGLSSRVEVATLVARRSGQPATAE